MADKIDRELRDRLTEVLSAGVTDDAVKALKKKVDDVICYVEEDIMYRLKDELAPNLSAYVANMASRAVDQILNGNEDQMRRYLSCEKRGPDGEYIGWTGRSDAPSYGMRVREPHEWHPVIHGKLHLSDAVELRRKIAEAHRDLIASERIKDLEDQVASLVAQVNRANAEKERMWQRVRDLQPS